MGSSPFFLVAIGLVWTTPSPSLSRTKQIAVNGGIVARAEQPRNWGRVWSPAVCCRNSVSMCDHDSVPNRDRDEPRGDSGVRAGDVATASAIPNRGCDIDYIIDVAVERIERIELDNVYFK